MRAFKVSLRTRRLPRKRMRSMTVPGGCGGGFWNGCSAGSSGKGSAKTAETFEESAESKEEEDGDATASGWRGAATSKEDASKKNNVASESRTRITPNGKDSLV